MRTGTWHLISELSDLHGCMAGGWTRLAQSPHHTACPASSPPPLRCTRSSPLDPLAVLGLDVPAGEPRFQLRARLPHGVMANADVSATSVRRAARAVREHGPDAVTVQLHWRMAGTKLIDPGIARLAEQARQVRAVGIATVLYLRAARCPCAGNRRFARASPRPWQRPAHARRVAVLC